MFQPPPKNQAAAAAGQIRPDLLGLDGVRHVPIGIEHDLLHVLAEDRRLLVGLADDHARRVDDLAVLDDAQHEFGDVDVHVEGAEVVGQPAPALHVDEDEALLAASVAS